MGLCIYPVGDRGMTLSLKEEKVSLSNQKRIWWIRDHLELTSIVDIILGMNNLTITFDPHDDVDIQALQNDLYILWKASEHAIKNVCSQSNIIEIPVDYGGEKGPDLWEVAKYHQLTPKELIERHSTPIYTVYFIGFMPGFVYLGGLDDAIQTPRRSHPRLKIPAGSVGIGGAQTGVYPSESPGGWQIIGNTEITFFDPNREQASLCTPGDQLKFVAREVLL